uniref:Sortase-like acyltransferase n=1 Tax=uncultured bacterium Contig1491 TaxID=1393439 RepID=W0FJ75_9BACT|nr:sortase-like acyltransferase [uncultured bacterium Contig1491]
MVEVRGYERKDIPAMADIWNEVVVDGVAFPQEETLDEESATAFFADQTHCGVAVEDGQVIGLYILHPNNVGRCGHIANASYAVSSAVRGKGVGRKLVEDSLAKGRESGFRVLQFNAVVASNAGARRLYEKLGFIQLGTIPGGFRMPDGTYADICPYYHEL